MNTLKNYIVIVFLLAYATAFSQQMQQKIDMKIDSVGNAKFSISMNMTAQQWQIWLDNLGNNPAALKREIERSMPAWFLDDFKLEKDDMNRSFNLSLNAYGVCDINKRGVWTLDTDQKDAQLTEINDHKYMFVSSPLEYGGTLQQSYTIEFPEEAKNIKVDKDAYGQTIFSFGMEGPSSGFNLMRWGGLALMVFGLAFTAVKIFS